MANCVIHPIPLFEGKRDKSQWTYHLNFGQQVSMAQYVWYIEGTKETILVDAGGSSEYSAGVGRPVKEIQTLESGLNKLGLTFGDIDLVILTHLHFDHVAQASRFSKARFLVQRDELEFARNPHPSVARGYHREFFEGLNFEVINGDARVCDEVSVLSTPGHTPGGQSVSIKTAQGTAIIAGLCTIRDNFEPPSPARGMLVTTPGIHTNVLEAYDSVLRIKEMADIILPLHEYEFIDKSSVP